MDWNEAMSEAREELGYSEDEYVEDFQGLVEEAKDILEYNKKEEYEEFCVDAYNNHQEYLKSERWRKLRLEILKRDNFTCQDCKEKAKDVHHIDYNYLGTDKEIDFCVSLCRECHKNRHNIKNKKDILKEKNHDYKCKKCEHRFCSDDDIPYCPACDCEDLNEGDDYGNQQ